MTLLPKHMFFSRGGKLEVEMVRLGPLPYLIWDGFVCFSIKLEDLTPEQTAALEQLLGGTLDVKEPDHP